MSWEPGVLPDFGSGGGPMWSLLGRWVEFAWTQVEADWGVPAPPPLRLFVDAKASGPAAAAAAAGAAAADSADAYSDEFVVEDEEELERLGKLAHQALADGKEVALLATTVLWAQEGLTREDMLTQPNLLPGGPADGGTSAVSASSTNEYEAVESARKEGDMQSLWRSRLRTLNLPADRRQRLASETFEKDLSDWSEHDCWQTAMDAVSILLGQSRINIALSDFDNLHRVLAHIVKLISAVMRHRIYYSDGSCGDFSLYFNHPLLRSAIDKWVADVRSGGAELADWKAGTQLSVSYEHEVPLAVIAGFTGDEAKAQEGEGAAQFYYRLLAGAEAATGIRAFYRPYLARHTLGDVCMRVNAFFYVLTCIKQRSGRPRVKAARAG